MGSPPRRGPRRRMAHRPTIYPAPAERAGRVGRGRRRAMAKVVSVNVGLPRTVEWMGTRVTTSIFKEPVAGPVRLRPHNLDGDRQSDLSVHGGPDKAVY